MCSLRRIPLACFLLAFLACSGPGSDRLESGRWRAWLDSPGGELPFGLEIERGEEGLTARLLNGLERVEFTRVEEEVAARQVAFFMDHYDSVIRARLSPGGDRLDGEWTKTSSEGRQTRLAFHATRGESPRFPASGAAGAALPPRVLDGRWEVRFSSDERSVAVGIFETLAEGEVAGTFLTVTGDYRYLEGNLERSRLRLSTFDGAHAFLFDARMLPDGSLEGEFWSGQTWHETWIAHRSETVTLPDAFEQSHWEARVPLEELVFPDLTGTPRSLADPAFAGRARILEIFGSWCPNCNDAAELLVELDERYRSRGLSILGLAFELSGEPERDARQVRAYADRHGITFPLLVAGIKDGGNESAEEALPLLDQIRAYPTTIFLDADGTVRAVHTGFAGPATGEAHDRLRAAFERTIEEMLAE
jgi:thiol-disulfide isomerase/thioredoxin